MNCCFFCFRFPKTFFLSFLFFLSSFSHAIEDTRHSSTARELPPKSTSNRNILFSMSEQPMLMVVQHLSFDDLLKLIKVTLKSKNNNDIAMLLSTLYHPESLINIIINNHTLSKLKQSEKEINQHLTFITNKSSDPISTHSILRKKFKFEISNIQLELSHHLLWSTPNPYRWSNKAEMNSLYFSDQEINSILPKLISLNLNLPNHISEKEHIDLSRLERLNRLSIYNKPRYFLSCITRDFATPIIPLILPISLTYLSSSNCSNILNLKELENLKTLEIDLYINDTLKTIPNIPPQIERLTLKNFNYMNINNDNLSCLEQLTQLKYMRIRGISCNIIQYLPNSIEELHIHDINFIQDIHSDFNNLKRLKLLSISFANNISDHFITKLPESIKELHLEYIDLFKVNHYHLFQNSYLNKIQLSNIHRLPVIFLSALPSSIQILDIRKACFTGSDLPSMNHLHQLTSLKLDEIENLPLSFFNSLPINIKNLKIKYCNLKDHTNDSIEHLYQLENLDFSSCHELPRKLIYSLPISIIHLDLQYTNLHACNTATLSHLNKLKTLIMNKMKAVPIHFLDHLPSSLIVLSIEDVNLRRCKDVQLDHLLHLKKLNFNRSENIDKKIFTQLPSQIEELEIAFIRVPSDIHHDIANLTHLLRLNIDHIRMGYSNDFKEQDITPGFFTCLPSSLEELHCYIPDYLLKNCTNESLSHLTNLKILEKKRFPKTLIEFLPDHLKNSSD